MPPKAPASTGSGPARTTASRRVAAAVTALAVAGAVAALIVVGVMGLRIPDSDEATLRGFQIRVLSISQAAAESRMDGALAALQALEEDLDAAARDGRISAPRLRGIEAALEAVRTEIAGQLAAPSPVPTAGTAEVAGPPVAAPVDPAVPQTQPLQPVSGEQAAAPQPVPVPATQQEAPPEAAKDAKGKGKGQGKP